MHFKVKNNLLRKIYSYFLRKALFRNRDDFHASNKPIYAGLLNEYISIDIMVDGVYDLKSINEIIELVESNYLVKKIDTLIDIGANIGNHSLFLAKYFKQIEAFEPNPFTFELLKLNASKYQNINIHNFGLSSKEGTFFLSEDSRNLGGSKIYSDRNHIPTQLETREVNLKKLDDLEMLCSKNEVLIKLDVEGHELKVLEGSRNFIIKNTPVICFEQHIDDFNDSGSPCINFLYDLGYEFYLFKSNFEKYKPFILKTILKSIFSERFTLSKINEFKPMFYDSIIAIHRDSISSNNLT